LLAEIQRETGMAYLFISHDLSVVRRIADRVLVMFAGRMLEHAPTEALFDRPRHPYARALLDARPILHPSERDREAVMPAADEGVAEQGCVWRLRCPRAEADCAAFDGSLRSRDGREWACLHPLDGVGHG
ncbi:MAG: ABC transporter ATP-binding protein, partial [Mariprofundaceae bacterium]